MMSCRPSAPFLERKQFCLGALLLLFPCILVFDSRALGRPQAGGVPAAGPNVRMVGSVAGTKGEELLA